MIWKSLHVLLNETWLNLRFYGIDKPYTDAHFVLFLFHYYSKNFFLWDLPNIYLKKICWRDVSCMYLLLKLRQIFNELCEWRGSGISIPWIHKYTLIFRRSKPFTDDPELFLQKGIDLFYIYLTLFFTNKLRPSKFLLALWRNVLHSANFDEKVHTPQS